VYQASFFDPADGAEQPIGEAKADAAGDWNCPLLPTFADWVIVLRRKA
jgi:hypothetical protein